MEKEEEGVGLGASMRWDRAGALARGFGFPEGVGRHAQRRRLANSAFRSATVRGLAPPGRRTCANRFGAAGLGIARGGEGPRRRVRASGPGSPFSFQESVDALEGGRGGGVGEFPDSGCGLSGDSEQVGVGARLSFRTHVERRVEGG